MLAKMPRMNEKWASEKLEYFSLVFLISADIFIYATWP